jgi:hypothetical protein
MKRLPSRAIVKTCGSILVRPRSRRAALLIVDSSGRSASLPLTNPAPARMSATGCGVRFSWCNSEHPPHRAGPAHPGRRPLRPGRHRPHRTRRRPDFRLRCTPQTVVPQAPQPPKTRSHPLLHTHRRPARPSAPITRSPDGDKEQSRRLARPQAYVTGPDPGGHPRSRGERARRCWPAASAPTATRRA